MSSPHAIYIEARAVHVQWSPNDPFVTLHESGDVSVQYREPKGRRIEPPHVVDGFSGTRHY